MKSVVRPRYVCRLCRSVERCGRVKGVSATPIARYTTATATPSADAQSTVAPTTKQAVGGKQAGANQAKSFWENQWTIFSASNAAWVKKAQQIGDEILNSKTIPTEEETLEALRVIESAARQLSYDAKSTPQKSKNKEAEPRNANSAASSLLSLDSKSAQAHPASVSIAVDLLSTLANKLITHPPVYITQPILATYVSIQSTLHRPHSFPTIFELYASKPTPIPGTSDPIRYRTPNPNASTQAIPSEVADKALDAAIRAKDLDLALDVIETSYATPAFRRNKFVKKALPPLSLFTIGVPGGALALALQLPLISNVPDPATNVLIGFTGVITYAAAVGTLGFVAITTSNDQMERVTWAQGTPLRERWIREEERAATDRVAVAWGLRERERWGDEEGVEWEVLRDWAARRRMWVDKVELMDGME